MSRRTLIGSAALAAAAASASSAEYAIRTGKLADWRKVPGCASLERAFRFLETTKFEGKAPGKIEIDGDRLFATLSQAAGQPVEGAQFEAHRKYIDIHYLLAGKELLGAAPAKGLKVAVPYDAAKEIEMYVQPAKFHRIVLEPGQFAVFLAGEAHLPGRTAGAPGDIRKLVVKIKV